MDEVIRGIHTLKGRCHRRPIKGVGFYDLRSLSYLRPQVFRPAGSAAHLEAILLKHSKEAAANVAGSSREEDRHLTPSVG
jgi:hypothetical protein